MLQTTLDALAALAMIYAPSTEADLSTEVDLGALTSFLLRRCPGHTEADLETSLARAQACLKATREEESFKALLNQVVEVLVKVEVEERVSHFEDLIRLWPLTREHLADRTSFYLVAVCFGIEPEAADALYARAHGDDQASAAPQAASPKGASGSAENSPPSSKAKVDESGLFVLQPVEQGACCRLAIEGYPSLGLDLAAARIPFLRRIVVKNGSTEALENARLRARVFVTGFEEEPVLQFEAQLPTIEPGEPKSMVPLPAVLNHNLLLRIETASPAVIEMELETARGIEVHRNSELRVLAHDQWAGFEQSDLRSGIGELLLSLLACHVLHQDPAIGRVRRTASEILESRTGSSSQEGYQAGAERATQIAEALFDALVAEDLNYSNPPAGSEDLQKVRTPSQILDPQLGKFGTCLDTACLYAACLEQAGLNPMLMVIQGHAFVAMHLEEGSSRDAVVRESAKVNALVDAGLLLLIETTAVTQGHSRDFRSAVDDAKRRLRSSPFIGAIDVRAARRNGLAPIPRRIVKDDGQVVIIERESTQPDTIVFGGGRVVTGLAVDHGPIPGRVRKWQAELLDLSLRNPLLNLRLGGRAAGIRLITPEDAAAAIEQMLVRGNELMLSAHDELTELQRQRGARTAGDMAQEDLRACLHNSFVFVESDAEKLVPTLRKIRNKARAVEEESGSNILHLTLGTVLWTDPDKKKQVQSPFLLIPVRLKMGTRGRPPRLEIDRASDGMVLNYCLLEKLRQSFRLEVPDLNAWSAEADGAVETAFQAFREAVVREDLAIDLEPSCALGLLHFGKFRMWRDLRDHWKEFMEASPFVAHMVERPGHTYEQEAQHPTAGEIETADVWCPVPYDGSQLEAIVAAAKGCSFVLEGPPGTGKSQTITNLIAHSLAEGRKVLFVAEKRAALDVVKGRLRKVGLGPFCLDIHDKKSTPKALREQLLESLEFRAESDESEYSRVRGAMDAVAKDLRDYSSSVHQVNAAGYSLWQAHQECISRDPDAAYEVPLDIVQRGGARLQRLGEICADLVADAVASGFGEGSPWSLARLTEFEPRSADVARTLKDLERALGSDPEAMLGSVGDISGPHGARALELVPDLRAARAGGVDPLPKLRASQASMALDLAKQVEELRLDPGTEELLQNGLSSREVMKVLGEIETARGGFFLFRRGRLQRALVNARTETLLEVHDVDEMQRTLQLAVKELKAVEALHRGVTEIGFDSVAELSTTSQRRALAAGIRWASLCASEDLEAIQLAIEMGSKNEAQLDALTQFQASWGAFLTALGADESSVQRWCEGEALFDRVLNCLPLWSNDGREGRFLMLARWCHFQQGLEDLTDLGLGVLVEALRAGELDIHDLEECAAASVASASRRERLEAAGLLRFDGDRHTRKTLEFADLIDQEAKLLLQQLPFKLLGTRPFNPGQLKGTIAELHRVELKRKRGGRSIRALLRDYSEAIATLTPCVLASPDSVAQYLEPGSMEFDLVVFDEASQVTVANAVGAMGRGRAVIVVGDTRQMPPTSFFSKGGATKGDDEDGEGEQEVVADDLESILEECVGSGLRRVWLSWHYRSEHEALIKFSNENYYEDRLSSFPAPGGRAVPLGIAWMKVEGGQFLTGAERTNPAEAEAIVHEVCRRVADPLEKGRSIGIVALNMQQADLIRDRLETESAANPQLGRLLEDDTESGIFVKNLENVQGDERDVIMISVTYAPSPSGAMRMQFGPLGQAGGERRWNVLVTRAKQQVVVFSSIEPEDIKLERISATAKGVHHMRAYLELARDGVERAREKSMRPIEDVDHHARSIAQALRQKGLLVQERVGLSSFKIDLAIGHPEEPGRWLVAVLLDGPGYQARATVRDRDALPKQVLGKLMHWPVVTRVWLPEWLAEPERVVSEIAVHVSRARELAADARKQASLTLAVSTTNHGEWISTAPLPSEVPLLVQSCDAAQAFISRALRERTAVRSADSLERQAEAKDATSTPPLAVEQDPRDVAFACFDTSQSLGGPDDLKAPLSRSAEARVKAAIRMVLESEGPVESERLGKLVANVFGIKRVRPDRVKTVLDQVSLEQRRESAFGVFVWPARLAPDQWLEFRRQEAGRDGNRTIDEVAPEELRNALVYLVETGVGISRSDAIADLADIFGVKRVSKGIRERLDALISWSIEAGACQEEDGMLRGAK